MDQSPQFDGRVFTPEDQLFPPLSSNDRHPSAPLLHTMLTSGIMNATNQQQQHPIQPHHPSDTKDMLLVSPNEMDTNQRSRSWSMPINANRPPLPPQISISSPDEPHDYFCKCHSLSIRCMYIYAYFVHLFVCVRVCVLIFR